MQKFKPVIHENRFGVLELETDVVGNDGKDRVSQMEVQNNLVNGVVGVVVDLVSIEGGKEVSRGNDVQGESVNKAVHLKSNSLDSQVQEQLGEVNGESQVIEGVCLDEQLNVRNPVVEVDSCVVKNDVGVDHIGVCAVNKQFSSYFSSSFYVDRSYIRREASLFSLDDDRGLVKKKEPPDKGYYSDNESSIQPVVFSFADVQSSLDVRGN
ncbi:unnamed protein product, partial [Ilex paraguariensis]